jgi:hypothetical protein
MPLITFQRRGLPFPWQYEPPGTATSTISLAEAVVLEYSLADPLAVVPPHDTLPAEAPARVLVDPATYAGTLDGNPGASTFDAFHKKWLLLTYAGAGKLFLMPQEHVDDIDAWLTQPAKTIAGPTFIPAPYGTDPKQYAIIAQIIKTHVLDYQEQ